MSPQDDAPIAILSFDRPDLLAEVLTSLAAQVGGVADGRVHLFQDGHLSRHRGQAVADPARVQASVDAFRRVFPGGRVHLARRNLGIAGNMGRAERYMLGLLRAPVAYFFEDDMVLAPYYLQALDALATLALSDERIGYVAAYGQNRIADSAQPADPLALVPMEHNWGFALTRRHWLEQQSILRSYRTLIAGADYRDRPHEKIQAFFWSLGYGSEGTSQDSAKHVASLVLGRLRLRCGLCFGRYIGRDGMHMRTDIYDAFRYADAQLHLGPPPRFSPPDDLSMARFMAILREDGRRRVGLVPPRLLAPAADLTLPLDAEGFVRVLYRGLLGREPDDEGWAKYATSLKAGIILPEQLIQTFLSSAEYRSGVTATEATSG